jgi:putative RecB family exonuclease
VSASRLNLWLRCPLAWKLKYIDRVPDVTTPSLFIGRQVHRGLERLYRRRQLGLETHVEDVTAPLLASWDEAVSSEDVQFADRQAESKARDQVMRLLETYIRQLKPDEPRPLAVETSLSWPLIDPVNGEDLGIPLVGIVDLILAEDAGVLIADFKTSASSKPPAEISHEIQLGCYSYLFRRMSGQQEAALEIRSLVKTKSPQIVFYHFAARQEIHMQRLFAVIRAYLEDLDRGRFLYRPGWTCSMCDHRDDHCRRWCG